MANKKEIMDLFDTTTTGIELNANGEYAYNWIQREYEIFADGYEKGMLIEQINKGDKVSNKETCEGTAIRESMKDQETREKVEEFIDAIEILIESVFWDLSDISVSTGIARKETRKNALNVALDVLRGDK